MDPNNSWIEGAAAGSTSSFFTESVQFTFWDYGVFALLLIFSSLIGVYYGFFAKQKQNNTEEYLLGGKQMNIFPVSVSLIASHISGISLLGIPAEIYANGTQYWAFIVPAFTVAFAMLYIYLPVFYELQVISCFTYLERRFDRTVRLTASFVYALACITFIPIVIYVPALAFNQVTGIDLHIVTVLISVVCIFYTTIGGLRAVVWTDTLQFFLMMGGILSLIWLGVSEVGSFSDVWNIAERGHRLIFFNMDTSPFLRSSFWTVSFGLTATWISTLGVNQGCVQRFLAVPSLQHARRSVYIFTIGLIVIKSCCCFIGLIIHAKYETCDPLSTKTIAKLDQVLPYYVMQVGGKIPGLPGLFIAGIFSAALSTMSSSLNTVAGTLFEDFVRPVYPDVTEKKASNIMKIIVAVLGFITLGLVFVVERLGSVFHLSLSITGVTAGTLLGMFSIGMFFRRVNTKGVLCGSLVSILFVATILVGAQRAVKGKAVVLPMRTDGCFVDDMLALTNSTTITDNNIATPEAEELFWLFRLSFMYYTLIGTVMVFAVGIPVSYLTGGANDVDEILLTPWVRSKEYKKKQRESKESARDADYSPVYDAEMKSLS